MEKNKTPKSTTDLWDDHDDYLREDKHTLGRLEKHKPKPTNNTQSRSRS